MTHVQPPVLADRPVLSLAVSDNVYTAPILQGRVAPDGVGLIPMALHPSELFWRQLHHAEFDISEMSLASLIIAASRGNRDWAAVPVFTMRKLFHTAIMVRRDAGIAVPADLRGKRVGVPEYQQSSAIWSRGILADDYGVDPRDIDWFMERGPDRSHGSATGFTAPPGVRVHQIAPADDIGSMLNVGTLDAALLYLPERNLVDRSRADLTASGAIVPLFADPQKETRRFHAAHGYLPINHTVVLRRPLLDRHPWLALNLYKCFVAAQAEARHVADAVLQPFIATGLIGAEAASALQGDDPMVYGMRAARPVLARLASYVQAQGLIDRPVCLDDIFAASTLAM